MEKAYTYHSMTIQTLVFGALGVTQPIIYPSQRLVMEVYSKLGSTYLDLHCDWLHNLQAVFIERVEKVIPHDVRL